MLTEFINKLLKMKQEAWAILIGEKQKRTKTSTLLTSLGMKVYKWKRIKCTRTNLRELAKLILNFFWGKFG